MGKDIRKPMDASDKNVTKGLMGHEGIAYEAPIHIQDETSRGQ